MRRYTRRSAVGTIGMAIIGSAMLGSGCGQGLLGDPTPAPSAGEAVVSLPAVRLDGAVAVEQALLARRSHRDYTDQSLSLAEIAQLLWAAQGITNQAIQFRTAPSAGALYPLETYVVAGDVDGLPPGVYRYRPQTHDLTRVAEGDKRGDLYNAALRQSYVRDAPAVLAFAAVYERTTGKYGERGLRYVHMEAGHASQNVYLQAVSLGIGTVAIGAFVDELVKRILHTAGDEQPLYLMPVGKM